MKIYIYEIIYKLSNLSIKLIIKNKQIILCTSYSGIKYRVTLWLQITVFLDGMFMLFCLQGVVTLMLASSE